MIKTIKNPKCESWLYEPGAVTMSQEDFNSLREGNPQWLECRALPSTCWKLNIKREWYLFIVDHYNEIRRLKIIIKD